MHEDHGGVGRGAAYAVVERRDRADLAGRLVAAYGAKYPKAVAKITDDIDQLLAFYDFPG